MKAIEAVIIFLKTRGVSGQQMHPFAVLRDELDWVCDGHQSIILQPAVDGSDDLLFRRYNGPGKDRIRTFAAACPASLYALGKTGSYSGFSKISWTKADQAVAKAMPAWPKFDTSVVTDRTIREWRIKRPKEPGATGYRFLIDQFCKDETGRKQLREVMKKGPPMTGGRRAI